MFESTNVGLDVHARAAVVFHAASTSSRRAWPLPFLVMEPRDRDAAEEVIANVAIARELSGWCWSLTIDTSGARQFPKIDSFHALIRDNRKTPRENQLEVVPCSAWSRPAIHLWAAKTRPRPSLLDQG